ncbi:MAG: hypothetical protein KZQ90_18405 [Candidatus Thiodiazotropha sp. (ex Codakia rugifera)]|nr:hypothetical protein [Candidatus Thiodiazotropha sp. (ex Codakia rugifera)]
MKLVLSILRLSILLLASLPVMASDQLADVLVYSVHEAGGEAVVSRLLITPTMLRIDQGKQDDDYILYDKRAETIYSVTPDEQSILVIHPDRAKRQIPGDMKLSIEQLSDVNAPNVGGSKPEHWRMTVNGEICQEAILAPGLMSRSLVLYGDYLTLLANQHFVSLDAIPVEYRAPCEDAVHVFVPTVFLDKGLPIRKWDKGGNQERLVEFSSNQSVSADYFVLPADYQQVPSR